MGGPHRGGGPHGTPLRLGTQSRHARRAPRGAPLHGGETAANPWLGDIARCSRTGSSNPSPSTRQSGLSPEFSFHVEKRRISAGVGGRGSRCGRKRRAERGEHSAVRGNISGGHPSTAAPVMLVAVT